MGGFSARKALQVVSNVEVVVAIELLCACQAFEFHRPHTSTEPLERVYREVRKVIPPWTVDRVVSKDIEAAVALLRQGKIWEAVEYAVPQRSRFEARSFNIASKL